MPIQVTCPGCKKTFSVSDKFAGKQGPCPNCKTKITIPNLPKPSGAPVPEVKVHGPEDEGAPGAATPGRGPVKPLTRKETRLGTLTLVGIGLGVVAAIVIAWMWGELFRESYALRSLALVVLAIPCAAIGYSVLREEELEPYEGMSFWLRTGLCVLLYSILSQLYLWMPADWVSESYSLLFVVPPFFLAGAGVAFICYDLDFGSGIFHFAFYAIVALALGWLAGFEMPWTGLERAMGF